MVAEHEIHAQVAHIEAARLLFAERREKQACGALGTFRNESEGESDEGEVDVLDHQVRRTEDGGLGLADDLAHAQVDIIMGVIFVADRVFSVRQVDGMVVHQLDVLTVQDAVGIVRDHVLDPRLAGIEVVADFLHIVGLSALGHHRTAVPDAFQAVIHAAGEDGPFVHVVLHIVGRQLQVLVLDGRGAIVIDEPVAVGEVADHRIGGIGEGRHLQGTLAQQGHGVRAVQGVHLAERVAPCQCG